MVSVVLYACFFEAMFTLMFFSYQNKSLYDYKALWIFISFMEVVKSAFARIIVLMTALGQHITVNTVGDNYGVNIGIVTFLYAISLSIAIIMQHMKDDYNMSTSTIFFAELPNHILNLIIFIWILLGFRKTIVTLNQSE